MVQELQSVVCAPRSLLVSSKFPPAPVEGRRVPTFLTCFQTQSVGTQNALKLKLATVVMQPNRSMIFVLGVQEPRTVVRTLRSLPVSWRFPPALVKGGFQHF